MKCVKGTHFLTTLQCDALRGFAITAIFLHNFCHWLRGANEECEYLYIYERSLHMWQYWTQGGIDKYFFIQFFSFFGHYGVPVFLFLSGWGLVMKYEKEGAPRLKPLKFLAYQWLKLFRLMILGLVLSVATYLSCGGVWHGIPGYLAQMLMITNVMLPNPGGYVTPGPYWFFGLMLQVYVVYVFLIYPSHDKKTSVWRWLAPVTLALMAGVIQFPLEAHTTILNYLRYNVVVALLPLAMGVLAARYGAPALSRGMWVVVALLALVLTAVASMNFQSWLWAPIVVITGAVAVVKAIENKGGNPLARAVNAVPVWMGKLSACIFVVHSIVRMPMFKFHLWRQHELMSTDYAWLAAYVALTILLAVLYRQYLTLVPKPHLKA